MNNNFIQDIKEKLSKVNLNEIPQTFYVTIEEHHVQTFEIQADSLEEAMEIAETRYNNGELNVCNNNPQAKLMCAENESGEDCTEWVEF